MRASLYLAETRGRFLYEIRPDLLPEGYLTDTELALWGLFYEHRESLRRTHKGR